MNKVVSIAVTGAMALMLVGTAVVAEDKPMNTLAAGKDLQAAMKDMQAHKWDETIRSWTRSRTIPRRTSTTSMS